MAHLPSWSSINLEYVPTGAPYFWSASHQQQRPCLALKYSSGRTYRHVWQRLCPRFVSRRTSTYHSKFFIPNLSTEGDIDSPRSALQAAPRANVQRRTATCKSV